jgi:TolA-binding protein
MSEQTHALPGRMPSLLAEENGDLMAHLEERVTRLVERHRESQAAIERLKEKLRDRERKVSELGERVSALGKSRSLAVQRLEGVIARVQELEKGGAASA